MDKPPVEGFRPTERRTCLLVLGMHRTGTSALTRVLSLLGAALPHNLMPPVKDNNEAGFWEPLLLAILHDEMLQEGGSRWADWRAFDPAVLGPERLDFYKRRIAQLVTDEYGTAPLFVLKEPRICRFVPLYEEVLAELGIDVKFLLPNRNPVAVIASLAKRDAMTGRFANLLWLRHVLDAEAATRGKSRAFLSYDTFLEDWRDCVARIAESLEMTWPNRPEEAADAIDAHLQPGLRHHRPALSDLDTSPEIDVWTRDTYLALTELQQNPQSKKTLDHLTHIKQDFETSAAIFGEATFPEIGVWQKRSEQAEARAIELDSLRDAAATSSMKLGAENAELVSQLTSRNELVSALQQENEEQAVRFTRAQTRNKSIQLASEKESEDLKAQLIAAQAELAASLETQLSKDRQLDALARENTALENRVSSLALHASTVAQALVLSDQTIARLRREAVETRASFGETLSKLSEHQLLLASASEELARSQVERTAIEINAAALVDNSRAEEARLRQQLEGVYASTSWRVSKPLRSLQHGLQMVGRLPAVSRRSISVSAYRTWHSLPMSHTGKQKLKNAVFTAFPTVFSATGAYRAWHNFNSIGSAFSNEVLETTTSANIIIHERWQAPGMTYVPILEAEPLANKPARVIAFYLPQFHPIPENNEWWGEGFTEWTNVAPARPQFAGHYQPHVPGELGYYDLRDPEVQRRQIELAKLYGIEGFCFYFYWFGGKRLLEKPLENWLADPSLDLPFCLCWANENWSRRWDGLDKEVLIAQNHSAEDDLAFIAEAAPYLRDKRYIRVNGRPMLLVYRPSLLPSAKETAARWRSWCRENGIGEIYLAYTQSFEKVDPKAYGFDAAIEFPPNNSAPPSLTSNVSPLSSEFTSNVYDWSAIASRRDDTGPGYKLFRSVCPGWDNTARRKSGGTVFVNNTPALYRQWLENALNSTIVREASDERLIFVNAWNEWAEGAHLEPDAANGYAYLQATRDALEQAARRLKPRIVIVSHDAHPHGAQYLAVSMAKGFRELGFEPDVIVLGDGPLLPKFAEVATVHRIDLSSEGETAVSARLTALRRAGAEVAVVNTTVSGPLVSLLRRAGFRTISLVHELPGVLESYKLQKHAAVIAADSDSIVFPAKIVQDGFEAFIGAKLDQAVIRPQGLLRRNPYKDRRSEAQRQIWDRHDLPEGTRIVVSVAYVDHRKGPDLFVRAAEKVLARHSDVAFFWIGHADEAMQREVNAFIAKNDLSKRVKFLGFVAEPMEYYAAASAYALTSREDPFPNVVLESAAVGVPVVAFDGVTGAADFIAARNGRFAKAFDADDFAAKLCDVVNSSLPADMLPAGSLRQYLLDLMHHVTGQPRVSVVVPNYNYARHLPQRLSSITGQTFPIYELIVLDDASSDASCDTAQAFLKRFPEIDSSLLVNISNSGSAFRQWQKGVSRCRGDIVWIAEADDFAEPTFVEKLVAGFNDTDVVLAYSQSRQVDETGTRLADDYVDYTADIGDRWKTNYTWDGRAEISSALSVKNTIPNVSAVLFRREALEEAFQELGENLYSHRFSGDWLVYLRVLLRGKIHFLAEALNSHRRHNESITRAGAAQRHFDEVAQVQAIARSLVPVSADSRLKADAWLDHVRSYLGIGKKSNAA